MVTFVCYLYDARWPLMICSWDKDGRTEILLRGSYWIEELSDDGRTVLLDAIDGGYFVWREGRGVAAFARHSGLSWISSVKLIGGQRPPIS